MLTRPTNSWRIVTGTFQIRIPVTTGASILEPEQHALAIMKWRLASRKPSDRWYPVLQRYVEQISARVDGLGGNAAAIEPSPRGVMPSSATTEPRRFTGKICEVRFDCRGDFEGFVLSDCSEAELFASRERGIRDLALQACADHSTVTVVTEPGPGPCSPDRATDLHIVGLVIRC